MFAKSIVMSDAFLDMPATARCLYFTLGMFADDDGFVNSPKSIMRQCGASMDDMNVLIGKKFVYTFESGVVVIKHWRIHNLLRADRRKETNYKEELLLLSTDENGAYTWADNKVTTKCQPSDNQVTSIGIHRLGKDSLGKDSKGKVSTDTKPTIADITAYIDSKKYSVIPQRFYEYYTSDGRELPENWQAVIDKWQKTEFKRSKTKVSAYITRGKTTPQVGDFGTEYLTGGMQ